MGGRALKEAKEDAEIKAKLRELKVSPKAPRWIRS